MKNYKEFFKNKKVTVVGLGLLGKGLSDTKFLAECGADIIVTDLKTREQLKSSVDALKGYKNITFSLGGHKLKDFENKDFILKGQGVPLDSIYIKHARKNGIPVEMDEALFIKLVKDLNLDLNIIGVTGTRGKSTTTFLIYEILKLNDNRVHISGNMLGTTVLPLLKKVKNGDTVVFELSSWQLQGFGEDKISPHISVFTNFMPDHLNYYGSTTLTTRQAMQRYFKDKAYIYTSQTKDDFLVLGESMKKLVKGNKSKTLIAKSADVPKSWKIKLLGEHNKQNIMCAVEVARILNIKESIIKKVVESFGGVPGRLELVREVRGVKIYNDTNATTPEATIAALNSFKNNASPKSDLGQSKVILIMGGMDKGIDVKNLNKILAKKTKKVFLTPGSGSDKIDERPAFVYKVENLKEAVEKAYKEAKKEDIILFSPGFASFNMFKNEYDRGEQFMKIVKKLK
ncbi:MAG: UDP-N-acetylmuramoylalanine-D-glutamate ligase [Candidatus Nomurabacteria bacterium GW2011_GWA2_40_9]|uniref:UDP-N-acetylmuramoylalanine--D-glutamate ligase n=1 Tax=Candidatus Nomurabacteria bacterium GW2011_GWA2_40_9 TaxID=1618734 RepID=A0A0G0TQU0_9BACT|nr:MAG: UDP-N-acetylmuramoylalanine-D-glutamate ligase [Candidatus Nomurabacteria bacterium GW2011_GWA2_40_9]